MDQSPNDAVFLEDVTHGLIENVGAQVR